MSRITSVIVLCMLVGAAIATYAQKHEAGLAQARAEALEADIADMRDDIAILRAEWATLTDPARIESIVAEHLDLVPVEHDRFVAIDDLPFPEPEEDAGVESEAQ